MADRRNADAIVVGGGATGLAAAGRLSAEGRRVLLLEARDRLGGRIHTTYDGQLPIELGAEFVHGEPPETFAVLRAAGIAAREITGRQELRERGRRLQFPDPRESLDHLLQHATDRPDQPVSQLFNEHLAAGDDPDELAAAARYVEGFHAADLDRAGTHALAESEIVNDDGEAQFRLPTGYERFVGALAARLDPALVQMWRGMVVSDIAWRPGEVRIAARDAADGRPLEYVAPRAVLTLPLGVLRAPKTDGVPRLDPVPEGWNDALHRLEMGAAQRIVLRFDRPWWMEGDGHPSFVFGANEAFPVWWTFTPKDAPILTGWAGGPSGERLTGLPPEEVVRRAIASAAKVFGRDPAELRDRLHAAYHHDWSADPFARGAYSYGGVGALPARRFLRQPVEDTLYLAGEALAERGRNGTVQGALADGYRAGAAAGM